MFKIHLFISELGNMSLNLSDILKTPRVKLETLGESGDLPCKELGFLKRSRRSSFPERQW